MFVQYRGERKKPKTQPQYEQLNFTFICLKKRFCNHYFSKPTKKPILEVTRSSLPKHQQQLSSVQSQQIKFSFLALSACDFILRN